MSGGTNRNLGGFVGLSEDTRRNIEQDRLNGLAAGEKQVLDLSLRREVGNLAGSSSAMQQILLLIRQVAPTSAPVLICGESGTGKELVARMIHQCSPRSESPFVAINAAAVTRDSDGERVIRPRERSVYGSRGALGRLL